MIKEPGCTSECPRKPLLDRTEEVRDLRTSLSCSLRPELAERVSTIPARFPVRGEVNLSQKKERKEGVAVEADHGDDDPGVGTDVAPGLEIDANPNPDPGRDPSDPGRERGDGSLAAGRGGVDRGPMRETGRSAGVIRILSLLSSRKYQVNNW